MMHFPLVDPTFPAALILVAIGFALIAWMC